MQPDHVSGERRPVTALFVDVVGSTSLAERMDPEDWAMTMERAMATMTDAVGRYDGWVAAERGDVAGDDPSRAAALFEELGATADLERVRELRATLPSSGD